MKINNSFIKFPNYNLVKMIISTYINKDKESFNNIKHLHNLLYFMYVFLLHDSQMNKTEINKY